MGRAVEVPITPSVLAWAIRESGLAPDAVAERLGVDEQELGEWLSGQRRPTLTAFKDLARVLRRPTATFLLPEPPKTQAVQIEFRHPPGVAHRELLPEERIRVREVGRLQRAVAWLNAEMGEAAPELPLVSQSTDAEQTAQRARTILSVPVDKQFEWRNVSVAFKQWRRAFEDLGVLVFLLPMGKESARGFSLWNDAAPAIVLNTHWGTAARIYTLFHEFGHLLTRTNSVCVETFSRRRSSDIERWCEAMAAAALMPPSTVQQFMKGVRVVDVGLAKELATYFSVSLRAAAIRLIDLHYASWSLYQDLPPLSDSKSGGGGGTGRKRATRRFDEYGRRTSLTFVRAVRRDVISTTEAMRLLDVGDQDLGELEKLAAA
jgi:Zn-dependent peptidase ImmA (M78 family)